VLQNLEEIYWQLAERGQEQVDVVTLGPDRFCVFNTSPIAKYEPTAGPSSVAGRRRRPG